jgi:hypothetical protein
MIRSSVFRHGVSYRELFAGFQAEDFDLWYQVLNLGAIHNLTGRYLQYRVHPGQVSTLKARQVALSTVAVVLLDLYKPHGQGRGDHVHESAGALFARLLAPLQMDSLPLVRRLRVNLYFGYLGALELLQVIRAKLVPRTPFIVADPISSELARKSAVIWSLILIGPVALIHLHHVLRLTLRANRQCSECTINSADLH